MMTLRIAHVTATFPPYYGGTGNVCYHNARVLAERGHEVEVYTASADGAIDNPAGVRVHRLNPTFRIGNAPFLPQLATLRKFDLIHLHLPFIFGAEITTLCANLRNERLVLTYHNDLVAPGFRGRLFSVYERFVTTRILRAGRTICAVSLDHFNSSTARTGMGHRNVPLVEMPNGVDATVFRPSDNNEEMRNKLGIPQDAFVVAFVGRLDQAHHFKRLDLLLKSIAASNRGEIHGLVVGDGPLKPFFQTLSRDLGLTDRIHFTGTVAHSSLPPYLTASDALVLPSDSVESFGLVLVEAMACGLPVIATNLPGVREVVSNGDDGFVVPVGDAAALSSGISRLADLPAETRKEMGYAGRRKVENKYEWRRIGERLEALYLEVLAARTAQGVC